MPSLTLSVITKRKHWSNKVIHADPKNLAAFGPSEARRSNIGDGRRTSWQI